MKTAKSLAALGVVLACLTGGTCAVAGLPQALQPVAVTGEERDRDLERADAFLSGVRTMVADFVQVSGGKTTQGKLWVQKPGKLRFEYALPATVDVVADGKQVAVEDRRLRTQDTYPIDQTPLRFLLKDKVDLAADVQVLSVDKVPGEILVLFDDHTTYGGTSRVRLLFDAETFRLNRWQVVDPQGYETLVELSDVDLATVPDPRLFEIKPMGKAASR